MKIEQNILKIIEQGRTDGSLFFLPNIELNRKVYINVNKVLDCLGGKWDKKLKAHVFKSNISDAIDSVLLTGEATDEKKEFQFFETPPNIVNWLIELAEVEPTHSCLEPSAGQGKIAEALRDIVLYDKLTCVEIMPENVSILESNGFHVFEEDFLQFTHPLKFDRIVMNPPFTKQSDVTHVLKALTFLDKKGILVSVMSAGVNFRQNKKTLDFWETINEKYNHEVIELPSKAFKVAGTMVNTIILKISSKYA
uniref:Putative methyltransferase n=1 Tax=viral metagenome TaxID=1070528 RepID=A0A6M3LPX9_9ZZZZ